MRTSLHGKDKEGTCLLNMRRSVDKIEDLSTQPEVHRQWREKHAIQMQQLKQSEDVLDDFIKAQAAAGTACSARLMEAKRALDSLNSEAKSLSNQVDSHEEVLETESENLNITKLSIKSVEEEYVDDVKECNRLKAEALKDMKQYAAELKELREIANPKAKYTHKESVDIPTPSPKAKLGLLELGEFTQETCLAFVHFMNRRSHSLGDGDAAVRKTAKIANPKQACEQQRDELQKDITDLMKDAKERAEDTSCYEDATGKKTAALVPLAAAREVATARIEHANDAIAALEPVVTMLKDRIAKLIDHIDEKLTPECMEAGEVSKILANIRELIVMVEECPGQGNFRLLIPKVKATVAPVVATTDAPMPATTDAPMPATTDAPMPAMTDAPMPATTDAPMPATTDFPEDPAFNDDNNNNNNDDNND